MGTILQERGLQPGKSPEELNLTMPEVVASVHSDNIQAGADLYAKDAVEAVAKIKNSSRCP